MAGKADEGGCTPQPSGKVAEQLKESSASLPSLATLDPSKGDGFLAWLRSLNFNAMTKRFCGNFGFRAMGRMMKFGYSIIHQHKELGSMDVQQEEAASVVKVACTSTAARRLAFEFVRPPPTLVHFALNPLTPFSFVLLRTQLHDIVLKLLLVLWLLEHHLHILAGHNKHH